MYCQNDQPISKNAFSAIPCKTASFLRLLNANRRSIPMILLILEDHRQTWCTVRTVKGLNVLQKVKFAKSISSKD